MTPASLLLLSGLMLAQAPAVKGLEPFRSDEGGFTVLLPGKPMPTSMKRDSANGEVEINIVTLEKEGLTVGIIYSDHLIDSGPPNTARFLDGVVSGLVGTNKVIKRGDLKFEGGVARSIEWEVKFFFAPVPYLARGRIYLKNGRLFQVLVQGPTEKTNGEMSKAIFDSFKIIDFKLKAAPPGGSERYVAADSRFEVVFPTKPRLVTQPFRAINGGVKIHRSTSGSGMYAVITWVYPESARQASAGALLDLVEDVLIDKGEVTQKTNSTSGGVSIRNLRWKVRPVDGSPTSAGRARIFLKDLELYQVFVLGTSEDCDSSIANRMFDSFKILSK